MTDLNVDKLAHAAYVAFVQICKGNSDDAGTYAADEKLVRQALQRLDELESDYPFNRARAALAEPDPSEKRPDRLCVGDVWEFCTEVNVKGKRKPVDKLLQWEVMGWHNGQYAWELQSLDGEHKVYLMEFAPSYEEMRFVRRTLEQLDD